MSAALVRRSSSAPCGLFFFRFYHILFHCSSEESMKCLFVAVVSKMSFGQRLMKVFVGPFWSEDVFPFVMPLCSPFFTIHNLTWISSREKHLCFQKVTKHARGAQKREVSIP